MSLLNAKQTWFLPTVYRSADFGKHFWFCREKLRELPSALHLKYKLVQLRGRLADQGDGSGWGFMKFWYNRMINKVNSFYNHGAIFKLWESRIKVIEGEFGTGVGTYFRFLRTYFFHGLFVGILGYAVNDLLYIPHLYLLISSSSNLFCINQASTFCCGYCFSLAFIVLPQLVLETDRWSPDSALEAFTGIFTGRVRGWL